MPRLEPYASKAGSDEQKPGGGGDSFPHGKNCSKFRGKKEELGERGLSRSDRDEETHLGFVWKPKKRGCLKMAGLARGKREKDSFAIDSEESLSKSVLGTDRKVSNRVRVISFPIRGGPHEKKRRTSEGDAQTALRPKWKPTLLR